MKNGNQDLDARALEVLGGAYSERLAPFIRANIQNAHTWKHRGRIPEPHRHGVLEALRAHLEEVRDVVRQFERHEDGPHPAELVAPDPHPIERRFRRILAGLRARGEISDKAAMTGAWEICSHIEEDQWGKAVARAWDMKITEAELRRWTT